MGILVELLALLTAFASAGAGHGHYVAARALFPGPMLLTVFQGNRIGTLSIVVGLLQFPFYGGLGAWIVARRDYLPAAILASGHVFAALVCLSGSMPNFS
ncbi:MAG: hypothetical protein ACJ8DZ_02430 [Allosphingosinicella sp.]